MKGLVYLAYGAPAIHCMQESLTALRRQEPNLAVLVLSDQKIDGVDSKIIATKDLGARSVKLGIYEHTPSKWQQVMYIDADVIPLLPLSRFFEPLDQGWELVMCQDDFTPILRWCRLKRRDEKRFSEKQLGTLNVSQLAGGAFAFRRSPAVRGFFRTWREEWMRYRFRDQGALVRALARVPLKLWTLGARTNWSTREGCAELWHRHGKARRRGAQ